MKNKNKRYEAPHAEVIEIESQGVLCVSGDSQTSTGGGGTQGMGMTNINWP